MVSTCFNVGRLSAEQQLWTELDENLLLFPCLLSFSALQDLKIYLHVIRITSTTTAYWYKPCNEKHAEVKCTLKSLTHAGFLLWNQLVLVVFRLFLLLNVRDAGEHAQTRRRHNLHHIHNFRRHPLCVCRLVGPAGGDPCLHLNGNSLECRRHADLLLTAWCEWQPLVVFTVVWPWSDHTLCFISLIFRHYSHQLL